MYVPCEKTETQKRTDFFVGVGFVSGLCNLLICVSRLLGNFGLWFVVLVPCRVVENFIGSVFKCDDQ